MSRVNDILNDLVTEISNDLQTERIKLLEENEMLSEAYKDKYYESERRLMHLQTIKMHLEMQIRNESGEDSGMMPFSNVLDCCKWFLQMVNIEIDYSNKSK
jgi:hypothetical protein